MLEAEWKNDIDLFIYHISSGENSNYQHPEFLTTSLIESIQFDHLAIARFLLDNGADPETRVAFTPFCCIQGKSYVQIYQNLVVVLITLQMLY